MNYLRFFVFSFFFSFYVPLFAQRILPQRWMDVNNVSDRHISVGDNAKMFGSRDTPVEGDVYENAAFRPANIYFYSRKYADPNGKILTLDSAANVSLRIDLLNNVLEFDTESGIKILPVGMVSNIIVKNADGDLTQYVNPKEFGSTTQAGLFELLSSGNFGTLVAAQELIKQGSNYVPALGTGNPNAQFVKKEHYYWYASGQLREIKSKNDLLAVTGDRQSTVEAFIKKEKLRGKSKEDLALIACFYNGL